MLTLQLEDFMVEFEEGTLKHVGTSTKSAEVKLFHVDDAGARAFGDDEVRLEFADGEGNEATVTVSAGASEDLAAELAELTRGDG